MLNSHKEGIYFIVPGVPLFYDTSLPSGEVAGQLTDSPIPSELDEIILIIGLRIYWEDVLGYTVEFTVGCC